VGRYYSSQAAVEKIDGKLTIPLAAGADKFVDYCRCISGVHGEYLEIVTPEWLAGTLRIEDGSRLSFDNDKGKNIRPHQPIAAPMNSGPWKLH
jgi:hypothetical protein